MSYESEISRALGRLGKNGTENPDAKHNTGKLIGEAFLWERVAKFAENKAKAVWTAMEKEGLIPDKRTLDPGDHELAYSPSFTVIAKATQPVKRFDPDEMANLMAKSKYKVPVSTTKEFLEMAKVPTKPVVSMKIVERG
jgi:hypothetical protein